MTIAVGEILAPASPGTVDVDVGFEVGSVVFLSANMDDPGSGSEWREQTVDGTTVYDLCLGMAGISAETSMGVITNYCLNWSVRASTPSGADPGAGRSFFDDSCVRHRDDDAESNPVTAAVTALGQPFTLDFSATVEDRRIWYIAFPTEDDFDEPEANIVIDWQTDETFDIGETGKAGLLIFRGETTAPNTWFDTTPLASIGFFAEGSSSQRGGIGEAESTLQDDREWAAPQPGGDLVIQIWEFGPLGTLIDGYPSEFPTADGFTINNSGVQGFGAVWLLGDDEIDRAWYGGFGPALVGSRLYDMGLQQKDGLQGEVALVLGAKNLPVNTTEAWRISLGIAHPELQVCIALSKDRNDGSITQGVVTDASWIARWDHDDGEGDNFRGTLDFPEPGLLEAATVEAGTAELVAASIVDESGLAAVTIGAPSPVFPTVAEDDIVVLQTIFWGPNTVGDASQIPTPINGWELIAAEVGQPSTPNRDGWIAWFWKRMTSDVEFPAQMTRPTDWDVGGDTFYGGRYHVIRGVVDVGTPWDDAATAGPYTGASGAFPAIGVDGDHRLVVIFAASMDNQSEGAAPGGWTAGDYATSGIGTDGGAGTFYREASADTPADASNYLAPGQGAYAFCGVSFIPCCTDQLIAPWVVGSGGIRHEVPFLGAGYA